MASLLLIALLWLPGGVVVAQEQDAWSDPVLAAVAEGDEPATGELAADAELDRDVTASDPVEHRVPVPPTSLVDVVAYGGPGGWSRGLALDGGIESIVWPAGLFGIGGRFGGLGASEVFGGRSVSGTYGETFAAVRLGDVVSTLLLELGGGVGRVTEREVEGCFLGGSECTTRTLWVERGWRAMVSGGAAARIYTRQQIVIEAGYRGAAVLGVTSIHSLRFALGAAF